MKKRLVVAVATASIAAAFAVTARVSAKTTGIH